MALLSTVVLLLLHFFSYLQLCVSGTLQPIWLFGAEFVLAVGLFILVGLFHSNHMLFPLLNKPTLSKGEGSLHLAKRDLGNSFIAFTLNFLLWSLTLRQSGRLCLMAQRTKRIDHTSPIFIFILLSHHCVTSNRTFTIEEEAETRILVCSVFHPLLMKLLLSLYELWPYTSHHTQ